jgi:hypothetical protein
VSGVTRHVLKDIYLNCFNVKKRQDGKGIEGRWAGQMKRIGEEYGRKKGGDK